ncbi:BaeS Signal transduction histidine kinase [Sphingomonadaceae bacterium]
MVFGPSSLSRRQLTVMLSVLAFAAIVLGVGGAWFASSYTERSADRVLRGAATAISETLAVEQGQVSGEVPIGAFSFLEDSGRDSVFYSVSQGARLITGYSDLGLPQVDPDTQADTTFRYGKIFGQRVRIATQIRQLPRQREPVVVQLAETLNERWSQTFQMLVGFITLELILVAIAALLIRPAVRWGLKPVTRLQAQLMGGIAGGSDIEPLDTSDVPIELRDLVDGFNLLLYRLGDALSAHRQFTGDASHQMRTPLAILKTHVSLLKKIDLDCPEARASIADIESAGNRLERLLSQLLSLARAEGGAPETLRKRVRLGALTADLCRHAAPAALNANIDIQFECQRDVVVTSYPVVVEEIVSNLLDNAVRYNRSGGSVYVRVGRIKKRPFIEVADNGPGIASDDHANVFKRFYRLNRDHNKSGSGLGLPIAKVLAHSISADLLLEDANWGEGCKFTLIFDRS